MLLFELFRTKGKSQSHIHAERIEALDQVCRMGTVMLALAGLSFFVDLLAKYGALPWEQVQLDKLGEFYTWDIQIRIILSKGITSIIGIILLLLGHFLKKNLNANDK